MAPTGQEREFQPEVQPAYRFLRALLRGWFTFVFRKIRVLRAEVLPASDAVILVISHPASFLDALILVAAFPRQVHCLLSRDLVRGTLRGFLARHLGMIPFDPSGLDRQASRRAASEALEKHGAVAVFADPRAEKPGQQQPLAAGAAVLALQTVSRHSGKFSLSVIPVHVFLPIARPRGGEVVFYVEDAVPLGDYTASGGGDPSAQARRLAAAIEQSFHENAFRLHPGDIKEFLADLEEILRVDLRQGWAERPNWKQEVEGFELSEFIAEWVDQLNSLNPGRLVALRDELARYREERRRWAQRRFEVEAAGAWLKSPLRRLGLWVESAVGLPVAVYGLLNHLVAGAVLFWSGLLRKDSGREPRAEWMWRSLMVLGCYTVQVLLCAHLLGRAAAGYYVLTLPMTGVYLWRYWWLVRHRTRLLFLSAGLERRSDKLRNARKHFIEEMNSARDAYADALGIPH